MKKLILLALFLLLTSISFAQDNTLTVLTHDSFAMSEDLLEAFQNETGITVEILRGGDAGQIVNQAILTKNNPLADMIYGVDNTFLSRALDNEIFEVYESVNLADVDDAFLLADDDFSVTPIDYGDVCLNYDVAYFEENELDIPESLADLTDEQYKGLLVTMNPATSSPGLAFLMATVANFPADSDYTYLDFWADLQANDMLVVDGWSDAYFGEFTAGAPNGSYPMVVSYASSPPFSVDPETNIAATASLVADGMCFRQVEYAGILANGNNPEAAQLFIDFMLSEEFQTDLPWQMFVFPVRTGTELPIEFEEHAQIPDVPADVSAEDIEANREQWITEWTELILR